MAKKPPKPKKVKQPLSPRAKKVRLVSWGIFAVLFIAFLVWGFGGGKYGDMRYAVCYTFAQRNVQFPTTLKVRDYRYIGNKTQIWLTHIDASGQYIYQLFSCEYKPQSFELLSVSRDNKFLSQEQVNKFNYGIQAILTNPPDLKLPYRPKEIPLKELWHGEY